MICFEIRFEQISGEGMPLYDPLMQQPLPSSIIAGIEEENLNSYTLLIPPQTVTMT